MKSGLFDKVQRHAKTIVREFENDLHFSFRLAFLRAFNHVYCLRKSESALYARQNAILRSVIMDRIPVTLSRTYIDDNSCKSEIAPVWVCWWDGLEKAPDVIKRCVRSIQEHAGEHPVRVLDKYTIKQYLTIPDYITDMVEKKRLGLANLCDYIRVALLEKYGGLWLDATIFCSQEIPDWYFTYDVFTIKSKSAENKFNKKYISNGRWVTYCIGGRAGTSLFQFLRSAFEEIWSTENYNIDYLMFDYLIDIAYSTLPEVRDAMLLIPESNPHRSALHNAMCEDRPASELDNVLYPDTVLYKLSWKSLYGMKTASGEESVYARWLNS